MTKTKRTLTLILVLPLFLLLGAVSGLIESVPVSALGNSSAFCAEFTGDPVGSNEWGECTEVYNDAYRELNCGELGSGTSGSQAYENCLRQVEQEVEEQGTFTSNLNTGFDDSFSDPDNLCNDPITGDRIPNCNLKDCNGVLISIDVECADNENAIMGYLAGVINFLSFGIALIIVAVIVVAGGQYIHAKGNPQQVEEAKSRITNAILALVVYIFLYAILNWLVPGGLFG